MINTIFIEEASQKPHPSEFKWVHKKKYYLVENIQYYIDPHLYISAIIIKFETFSVPVNVQHTTNTSYISKDLTKQTVIEHIILELRNNSRYNLPPESIRNFRYASNKMATALMIF